MVTYAYTIFDRVAEEAGPLFEAVNDGIALRNFRGLLEKIPTYQHGDYRLYKVGSWSSATMELEAYPSIKEVLYSEVE